MELWEVRDEYGNKTGKILERGQPMSDEEYALGVFVLISNSEGDYLIQKRAKNKKIFPGRWEFTGGGVICGEDSKSAAIREVFEEVGLQLAENELKLVGKLKKKKRSIDFWLAQSDFRIEDCILDQNEVEKVAIVSSAKVIE